MPKFSVNPSTSRRATVLALLVAGSLLSACASVPAPLPQSQVTSIQTQYYNAQPDIEVPKPKLRPYKYDLARRTDLQQVVKNTSACQTVPVAQQDAAFWRRCGEFPIDHNSNLFIGFDRTNWVIYQQNWQELEAYAKVLEEKLAGVNRERAANRAKSGASARK